MECLNGLRNTAMFEIAEKWRVQTEDGAGTDQKGNKPRWWWWWWWWLWWWSNYSACVAQFI